MRRKEPTCIVCGVELLLITRNSSLTKYCKACKILKQKEWDKISAIRYALKRQMRDKNCVV